MPESIRKQLEKYESAIFAEGSSTHDAMNAIEALDHIYQTIIAGGRYNLNTIHNSMSRLEHRIKFSIDETPKAVFEALSELIPFTADLLIEFVREMRISPTEYLKNSIHLAEIVKNLIKNESLEEFSEAPEFEDTMLSMVKNDRFRHLAEDIATELVNIFQLHRIKTQGLSDLIAAMLPATVGMTPWVARNQNALIEPLTDLKFGQNCSFAFSRALKDAGADELAVLCAKNAFYNFEDKDLVDRRELLGIKLDLSEFSRHTPPSSGLKGSVLTYLLEYGAEGLNTDALPFSFKMTEVRQALFKGDRFHKSATVTYAETLALILSKLDDSYEYMPIAEELLAYAGIDDTTIMHDIHRNAIKGGIKGAQSCVLDVIYYFRFADEYGIDCKDISPSDINDAFYEFFNELVPIRLSEFFSSKAVRSVFAEADLINLAEKLEKSHHLTESDIINVVPKDIASQCKFLKKHLLIKDFGL